MRCVDLLGVRTTTRELRAGAASVDVDTAISKSDPRNPDKWFPSETAPLRLGLIQSESRWLISSIDFPEEELADQLVAARPDEQAAILSANADRLTRGLSRAIASRAFAKTIAG